MYLLDTVAISDLRKVKSGEADPGLVGWIRLQPPGSGFISSMTILEIERGVLLAERRDPPQGYVLRVWLEQEVLVVFERRILLVDTEVARRAAALRVPDPTPLADAIIAATALVHNMPVVTCDADFERFDQLEVINPWSSL